MAVTSKIEISYKTIIFSAALLVGAWLVFQIRDILFLLSIAFLLMTALHPLVVGLERIKIPRLLAIIIVYLIIFGGFGLSFAGTLPALIIQSTRLITELPLFIAKVLPSWNVDAGTLSQQIAPIGENVVKLTVGIFSNILTTLTVLVFSFYFLLERHQAGNILTHLMGESMGQQVLHVLQSIEKRLGAWTRGETILMISIGIGSYLGLSLLHMEFALPLAIIAGFLEIIPVIGPIVSAVPAVLVALSISPLLAVTVAALYFIIQQTENNVLVPIVMQRSIGLSPLVSIFALLVGARLAGVTGAILAVPAVLVLEVIISHVISAQSSESKK